MSVLFVLIYREPASILLQTPIPYSTPVFVFVAAMRFSTLLPLLLAAGVTQAQFGKGKGKGNGGNNNQQQQQQQQQQQAAQNGQNQNGQDNANNNANGGNADALALDPNNVQTNSQSDGLDAGAEAGQAASATSVQIPSNCLLSC